MNKELNRFATYVEWPESCCARPPKLARNGFYATGDGDAAMCYDCGSSVAQWQIGDDPRQKHRRESPQCSMINGQSSTNVPMVALRDDFDGNYVTTDRGSDSANRDVRDCESPANNITPFFRVCRSALDRAKRNHLLETDQRAPAVDPENPDFELLRREAARLATFTNFPANSPVTPSDLARAGFFHKGPRDRVQCAFCRGLLRNWVPGDDPMTEHRRHMPQCAFVSNTSQHGNVHIEDDNVHLYTATDRMYATDSAPNSEDSQVSICLTEFFL